MTNYEAIKQLQTEHDLIAGERDLDGSQFAPALLEALAMAIEVLKYSEIPNCSEPKCADGCIYGWGSSECGHCDYRSEEPKTGDSGFITCMNDEKTRDRTTGDCISRQATITEFKNYERDSTAPIDYEKIVEQMPSAQPERTCVNCGRTANNGGWYADGRTRCPIEEHYALPKDGFCHLWEKRNVTDDDYPERREE